MKNKKQLELMRKAFNFYRSYYDILPKIKKDEDKLKYLLALLDRQFNGVEPSLEGEADFAYTSQKHSIDKSVEGYESKTQTKLSPPTEGPYLPPTQGPTEGSTEGPTQGKVRIGPYGWMTTTQGPSQGGTEDPSVQEQEEEQEKEEEQVEEQVQEQAIINSYDKVSFLKNETLSNIEINKGTNTRTPEDELNDFLDEWFAKRESK